MKKAKSINASAYMTTLERQNKMQQKQIAALQKQLQQRKPIAEKRIEMSHTFHTTAHLTPKQDEARYKKQQAEREATLKQYGIEIKPGPSAAERKAIEARAESQRQEHLLEQANISQVEYAEAEQNREALKAAKGRFRSDSAYRDFMRKSDNAELLEELEKDYAGEREPVVPGTTVPVSYKEASNQRVARLIQQDREARQSLTQNKQTSRLVTAPLVAISRIGNLVASQVKRQLKVMSVQAQGIKAMFRPPVHTPRREGEIQKKGHATRRAMGKEKKAI